MWSNKGTTFPSLPHSSVGIPPKTRGQVSSWNHSRIILINWILLLRCGTMWTAGVLKSSNHGFDLLSPFGNKDSDGSLLSRTILEQYRERTKRFNPTFYSHRDSTPVPAFWILSLSPSLGLSVPFHMLYCVPFHSVWLISPRLTHLLTQLDT